MVHHPVEGQLVTKKFIVAAIHPQKTNMKSWTSFLKDPSDALCIVCKHINSGHQVSHKNIGGPELDGK